MPKYPFPAHPDRRPAVVAGASSGIGAATAGALAAAGFPVALGARRVERCEKLAAEIRESGGEAVAHQLDVSSVESLARFADAVRGDLGDVEVVVSNAGSMNTVAAHRAATEQIADEIDVNILGAHRLVAAFSPGMIERQRGDLVFVSSDVVHHPRPGVAGYMTGKYGLEGLVTAMQLELEGTGVRASLVRPGPTFTDIARGWDTEATIALVTSWQKFGLVRHAGYLLPDHVAQAIVGVVSAPRGCHYSLVEVNPEAPVETPS
jgi:NADP-dependent 3-hydroxy acid dehydrogenase YdfG